MTIWVCSNIFDTKPLSSGHNTLGAFTSPFGRKVGGFECTDQHTKYASINGKASSNSYRSGLAKDSIIKRETQMAKRCSTLFTHSPLWRPIRPFPNCSRHIWRTRLPHQLRTTLQPQRKTERNTGDRFLSILSARCRKMHSANFDLGWGGRVGSFDDDDDLSASIWSIFQRNGRPALVFHADFYCHLIYGQLWSRVKCCAVFNSLRLLAMQHFPSDAGNTIM